MHPRLLAPKASRLLLAYTPCVWRARRGSNPPASARQAAALPECDVRIKRRLLTDLYRRSAFWREMVGLLGFEPRPDRLRAGNAAVTPQTRIGRPPQSCTAIPRQSGACPAIGREAHGGRGTESNLLPGRDRVYGAASALARPYGRLPKLELMCGIEPQSARYQGAALPLSYTSGGEPSNRNSPADLTGAARSRRARRPRRLTLHMAEGEGIEPLASSRHPGFQDQLPAIQRHLP